jgi:hypothetical protein
MSPHPCIDIFRRSACATSPSLPAAPSGLPSSPRSCASLPTSPVRPCSPSHWSSPAQRFPTQSPPAGTCCTTWTLPWRTSIRDRARAACSHRRCSTRTVGILADHHFGVAGDVDAAEYSEEALVAIDAVDLERTSGEIDEGATCSTTSGRRSTPRKSGTRGHGHVHQKLSIRLFKLSTY